MTPHLPPESAEGEGERGGGVVESESLGDTVVDEGGVGANDCVGGDGDGEDEEGVGEGGDVTGG